MPKSYPKFHYSDWEWIAVSFPLDQREDMARAAWLITQCSPDEIEECIREQKSDPKIIIPLCLIEFTDEIHLATLQISSRCKKLLRCLNLEILKALYEKFKNGDQYITRNNWKDIFQPIRPVVGSILLFSLSLYIFILYFVSTITFQTFYELSGLYLWLFIVLIEITLVIINIYYNALEKMKVIYDWIILTLLAPFLFLFFMSLGTVFISLLENILFSILPNFIVNILLSFGTILVLTILFSSRGSWGIIVICLGTLLGIINTQIYILEISITLEIIILILSGILVGLSISLVIRTWSKAKPKQIKIQITIVFLFLYCCWYLIFFVSVTIFLLQFFSGLQIGFIWISSIGIGAILWRYVREKIRPNPFKEMEILQYLNLETKPSKIPIADDKDFSKSDQEFLDFLSVLEDK